MQPSSKVVVAVIIPTRGHSVSEFTFSLAQLVAFNCMTMVQDGVADFRLFRRSGTYIDVNRCDLAKDALEDPEVTHLFWLDDDMSFPADAMLRLLNHNKAIVGCNYSRRRFPLEPTAIKLTGGVDQQGIKLSSKDKTGLEVADAIGFGCCLVRRDVFEALAYPWFDTYWDSKLKKWVGEDVYFCRSAAAAGYETFVDHDLSQELEHFGNQGFMLHHAEAYLSGRKQVLELVDGE